MKKYVYAGLAVAAVLVVYFTVNAIFSVSYDVPTARVQKGEFIIGINTNGTIEAKQASTLSAPRIRGLQITWLAPEGSFVEEGAPVIHFDNSKQTAELANFTSDLKIKETALFSAKQEHNIQEKQLTLDLEIALRNYDEKKHEAPREASQAKLELELAQLNFKAKLDQLVAGVQKAEIEVQRAKDQLSLAQRELNQTIIKAPIPGMVVYLEIWKGGTMSKVQEGDSPWPGQGLVNLPDLSEMIVKTTVSEVDAAKVDTGLAVWIVMDAFPDDSYEGQVIKKSTLAHKKDYNSKINVFDVEVMILEQDDKFKPGMSASCDIVIERLQEIVSVPIEAVFEKQGQTLVYLENKKERAITVGRRNDTSIEVETGLTGDEIICLIDPTLEEQGLPGDRATKAEINRSSNSKNNVGGKRPSGKKKGR